MKNLVTGYLGAFKVIDVKKTMIRKVSDIFSKGYRSYHILSTHFFKDVDNTIVHLKRCSSDQEEKY